MRKKALYVTITGFKTPMGKSVTNKSFTKRIRITGTGKPVRRRMGVNHFKTRKNAKGIQKKRGTMTLDMSAKRMANVQNQ